MEEIIKETNLMTGSKIYLKKVRIVGTDLYVYAVVSYWYNLKEANVALYEMEEDAIKMYDFLVN